MSMLNGQELFCHLQNYVLRKPSEDNWESIKNATWLFMNCWTGGDVTSNFSSEYNFSIFKGLEDTENNKVFEFTYFPGEEFNIEIKWLENGEWESDKYKFVWSQ